MLYLGLIVVPGVLLLQPFVPDLLDLGHALLLLRLCLRPYLTNLVSLVHCLHDPVCPCGLAREFPAPGLKAIEAIGK